jgi:hypothetical protein
LKRTGQTGMAETNRSTSKNDHTLPSQPTSLKAPAENARAAADASLGDIPWLWSQFMEGEVDLHEELASRYPNQPLMSLIQLRDLPGSSPRGLATLATQDGAASLRVEVDGTTRATQFAFTHSSMLTLRFDLTGISQLDRDEWLQNMQRENGDLVFLCGKARWRADYLICTPRKHFANLYAFSPLQKEAAARLTADVTRKLTAWLATYWGKNEREEAQPLSNAW